MDDFIQGLAEESGGVHPGLHDFLPIFCVVTAVDIASRQIDQNVHIIQFFDPLAKT
jgi:hypothetical protein